ncbi:hypothetical protein [Halorhodospira abdelmalekii]|uniref:hypothetical protein n=1 Tax=Halorhodospira abdelmalekii TaxID=421629 RepID=UPI001904E09F|nr:hypothetical protein [Halorhodospira abdelmalekii]
MAFVDRQEIATTEAQAIRHLARQVDLTAVEQFKAQLRHQESYLKWIDSRHNELLDAKRQLDPNGRGPKDGVYRKYRWYAEQQSLLEAINAFEVLLKNSFIGLAKALRNYVPPEKIKGDVEAKVLWAAKGSASFASLIFEHRLFHKLDNVDDVTNMLIGSKRYMPSNLNNPLRPRVIALQAVFQIRHTLSHNQGHITQSDRAKFASLGYEAAHAEVIDPSENHFGRVVRDLLRQESSDFTDWLLTKTAGFLNDRHQNAGAQLDARARKRIERYLGSHAAISALPWA